MNLEVKVHNCKHTYNTITLRFDSVKILSSLYIRLHPAVITEMLYLTLDPDIAYGPAPFFQLFIQPAVV